MNYLQSIKQLFTNKTVVHAAMLAFAVTSTLNIAGFFVATQHHILVAASIGLALGAGLMAVSIYLSRQELWSQNFWMLLVAAVFMALLSGQIQTMAYQKHGLDSFTSFLLGYAPPFIVEILLALAVSLAERTEREQVQRDSKRFIKDSVAESMTTAFRSVDVSRIQRHIEKQVDAVIKAFVDDALGEMMAELNNGRQADEAPVVQPTKPVEQSIEQSAPTNKTEADHAEQPEAPKTPALNIFDAGREAFNAQQKAEVEQRRQRVLNILVEHLTLGISELHNLIGGDKTYSRGTLNNDLKALAEAGKVYNADRKWHIVSAIRVELPSLPAPTTNGLNGHH